MSNNNYERIRLNDSDSSNNFDNSDIENQSTHLESEINRQLTIDRRKDIISIIKFLGALNIIFLIIGLPMFCMGYIDRGPNINRYIKVDATITGTYHAVFSYNNIKADCRFLTGENCGLTSEACSNYAKFQYPIGKNLTLFYDTSIGYCRTEEFVNNLFIAGSVFLLATLLSFIMSNLLISHYKITKEEFEIDDVRQSSSSDIRTTTTTTKSNVKKTKTNKNYIEIKHSVHDKCSICLDMMDSVNIIELNSETNSCVILNCGHCYHKKCIDSQFKTKLNCPLCRKQSSNIELISFEV